ncbi:putative regulator of Ras-like GTPase activity (Roadblock/LC7/MglB family) [Nonomuraea thailandensis]|uniref:Regulator of Ras-like GTPase activity (Roadblock/LC7/MglB family) n=1 Tax=Nonomuraea thailandensis TaxID=1188745 RepID=A0A9X2GBF6_9ACTN|nr:roadblock/LC7 domain-containing protein [Nonomuraea thailandensis]MCP2354645.1 putative regulator of Ras-like GTPase activity (Roadblock/LC7/MglB family) [Nonomuraea thailandensis]
MTPTAGTDLNWLMDDLVNRVKEAEHAIVLSSDGLLMASSAGLQRTDGEHLSAVASGLQSLAKGVSDHISAGAVRQTVVEWKNQFLIVTAAGERACLAVLCAQNADIGLVAYEMAMMVARVGQYLTSGARNAQAVAGSDR